VFKVHSSSSSKSGGGAGADVVVEVTTVTTSKAQKVVAAVDKKSCSGTGVAVKAGKCLSLFGRKGGK